jgi:hypothetical protein
MVPASPHRGRLDADISIYSVAFMSVALMRGITLVALRTMLVAGTGTGDENRTFFHGQLIDINPGSRIITVRGVCLPLSRAA